MDVALLCYKWAPLNVEHILPPLYNFQAGLGLVLLATLLLATATFCAKAKQDEKECNNEKE